MKTAFLKRMLSVLLILPLLAGCFSAAALAAEGGSPIRIGILVSSRDNKDQEEEKVQDEDPQEKAAAALAVSLSLEPSEGISAGDLLSGTVVVSNTGNVTLKDGSLRSSLVDLTNRSFQLAPGETEEFRYQYMASQADIDAGIIQDTVTANAAAVRGEDPKEGRAEASATVNAAAPALTVSLMADNAAAAEGDGITYTLTVSNSGNVTIKSILLEDAMIPDGEVPQAFDLAPGKEEIFTFRYTVSEADVKAGKVERTARAEGKDPLGQAVSGSASAAVTAEVPEAALLVLKTAEPQENVAAGDEISYKVLVKNSGSTVVKNIVLADAQLPEEMVEQAFDLEAGAEKEFSFTYTATQADMDAGMLVGTATVSGEGSDGSQISKSGSAVVTMAPASAGLTAVMKVDPRKDVELGGEVSFTVIVANMGNVTLKDGRLTEDFAGFEDNAFELAPGSTAEFTYKKTAVQEDMDRGTVISTVRANAVSARGGNPAEAMGSASAETVRNGHLKVKLKTTTKAKDVDGYILGEKPSYKITVTNDGNLTLRNVLVTDSLTGEKWIIGLLKPGEKRTFTSTYTVTGEDIRHGTIMNQVTAAGSCTVKNLPEVKAVSKAIKSDTLNPSMTLTLNKVWEDDNDRERIRPSSLDFDLILNDETVLATITLDEENNWTTMIADVPKRFNEVKAHYSWREHEADGYTVKVENAGNTTTFTNTHETENVTLGISMDWDDAGNQARPSSLSMVLTSSEQSRVVTLSGANNWEAEITVPKYADGKELSYSWVEPEVAGYTLDVTERGNDTVMTSTREIREEEETQNYTVTVSYRYLDGSAAAPAYEGTYAAGGSFYVQSPDIPGYTPDKKNITGTVGSKDAEVVVLYLPGEDIVAIEEYKTPLGLGQVYVNTGDCIE